MYPLKTLTVKLTIGQSHSNTILNLVVERKEKKKGRGEKKNYALGIDYETLSNTAYFKKEIVNKHASSCLTDATFIRQIFDNHDNSYYKNA